MKDKTFATVLLCVTGLCAALTALHLWYAVNAYRHCSIIQFIAKELW